MYFAEQKAIVSQIDGHLVVLETDVGNSCSNCSNRSGCDKVSSIFTFKSRNKLKLDNTLDLKKGDAVILGMPSGKLLKATVLMYLSPLLLLFVFSTVAKFTFGESASIIAGLMGLFIGLLLVKFYSQKKIILEQFQPKLIRKIINIELV